MAISDGIDPDATGGELVDGRVRALERPPRKRIRGVIDRDAASELARHKRGTSDVQLVIRPIRYPASRRSRRATAASVRGLNICACALLRISTTRFDRGVVCVNISGGAKPAGSRPPECRRCVPGSRQRHAAVKSSARSPPSASMIRASQLAHSAASKGTSVPQRSKITAKPPPLPVRDTGSTVQHHWPKPVVPE